jgi:phosphoribosylglycinamide formyltransferase 2
MVTMISQDLSEFALHARAILALPVPVIEQRGPAASAALLVEGDSDRVVFENVDRVLRVAGVQVRLFGKPEVRGRRRMGVALAVGDDIAGARAKARAAVAGIKPRLE